MEVEGLCVAEVVGRGTCGYQDCCKIGDLMMGE